MEQEISRVRSLPGEPEPDYSTEYVPTNEPEMEPEENQSQTSRDEDNSQDDEDDEEEDNAKETFVKKNFKFCFLSYVRFPVNRFITSIYRWNLKNT